MDKHDILRLEPMGDQALLARCADERAALALADQVRRRHFPWLLDVVLAYKSVAFFVDLSRFEFTQATLDLGGIGALTADETPGKLHVIPCCYTLGLDLERVAQATAMPADEVIRLHASTIYTVHAIGFCPGFPYLGYLPDALGGVPRLTAPRVRVDAGSVGLTGRQTGIYTMDRPGGWNIIGRTPLVLVDVADGYFPLRTGDRVQFQPIDVKQYETLLGKRLRPGN